MNGAERLARTLVAGGIDLCFANPGTSEMHFLAALDRVEGIRCVLGLSEAIVTGAADGFGRMTGRPAVTLLHLGPGLANGLSNIHNARKASTPMVNIVGDHATYHRQYDAPLTSDIEAAARPFSDWVRTSSRVDAVADDAIEAIAAARRAPGHISTLILPADIAWGEPTGAFMLPAPPAVENVPLPSPEATRTAAEAFKSGEPCLLLIGGAALSETGQQIAANIAFKTGAHVMATTFVSRIERGAGRAGIERLPYPVMAAVEALKPYRHIILVHAKAPVAFFAYPDKPSVLAPPEATIHPFAPLDCDAVGALRLLADEVSAIAQAPTVQYVDAAPASGAVTPAALGVSIGALLPENAIVIDEGVSTGRGFFGPTRQSRPHDWLQNMGGSIGIGMPLATGAALACPDRRVVSLQADGSGMYTLQALWTQAREGLNVSTVIFANRRYAILQGELTNVGAQGIGRKGLDMLEIDRPTIDWVALAKGLGVDATRVDTMEEFNIALQRSLATAGPTLIEAVM
jgi:acetolactate synthase I/II/III large subunit